MSLATRLTLLCAAAFLFAVAPANSFGQEKEAKPAEKSAEPAAAPPKEESSVTDHSIKIAGQSIPYKATVRSLLLKTDLVFIDPIGTGFSHAVGKSKDKDFWGVDQDARSLANFVQSYISRNNRWNSPKFLIGESYGTFRNAVLSNVLQNRYNLYLNGMVMISSVWDLGTLSFYPAYDLSYFLYLPSYAATAWNHKVLTDRPDNLNAFLDDVLKFAYGDYSDALLKGSTLNDAQNTAVAKKLARFTGLSEDYLVKSNLRVKLAQFIQELQRSRGLTTGRLDARFSGPPT